MGAQNRKEKRIDIAKKAYKIISKERKDLELPIVNKKSHHEIPLYLNACNVLTLTSDWEGSPNVIKEAMAYNLPIVSTDVGDVKEIISKTKGSYVSYFDPKDVAEKIKMALNFGKRTNGRINIQHLEINTIARKIIDIYKSILR